VLLSLVLLATRGVLPMVVVGQVGLKMITWAANQEGWC